MPKAKLLADESRLSKVLNAQYKLILKKACSEKNL